MALIKCKACDREISDKSKTCIHCGHPIEREIYCIECGNLISENENFCNKCGCHVEIETSKDKIAKSKTNKDEKEVIKAVIDVKQIDWFCKFTLILGILFLIGLIGITFLFVYFCLRQFKQTNLALTNKRIYGRIPRGFELIEIDFPIDQVITITKTSSFKINSLIIESTGSTKYTIYHVSNADDFRKEFLNLIKK